MNRIDEFFRKKLAGHSDLPSKSDMNDMAALLNNRSGKNRTWLIWLFFLLLIGGGTLAWFRSDFWKGNAQTSSHIENRNQVQHGNNESTASSEGISTLSDGTSNAQHDNKNEEHSEKTASSNGESFIKDNDPNFASAPSDKPKSTDVSSLNSKSGKRTKSKASSKQQSTNKKSNGNSSVGSSSNESSLSKNNVVIGSALSAEYTPAVLKYLPYTLLDLPLRSANLAVGQIIPSDTNALKAKPELQWSIRASAGPEFFRETSGNSLTDDNYGYTNKATGMSFQVGVLRHFENWEFGTGLRFTSFRQPQFEDTISSLRIYFYQSPETLIKEQYNNPELREKLNEYVGINSLQMLSLPLHVGYNFCSDSKLHVIPFARLNINYVQQELLDFLPGSFEWFIETDEYTTSLYELWHQRRIRAESKITLGASLGVELRYPISRRLYCSGSFSGSWFFGPIDERLPNSKYLSTSLEALVGFKF